MDLGAEHRLKAPMRTEVERGNFVWVKSLDACLFPMECFSWPGEKDKEDEM